MVLQLVLIYYDTANAIQQNQVVHMPQFCTSWKHSIKHQQFLKKLAGFVKCLEFLKKLQFSRPGKVWKIEWMSGKNGKKS